MRVRPIDSRYVRALTQAQVKNAGYRISMIYAFRLQLANATFSMLDR
jgi:hypothetical protein